MSHITITLVPETLSNTPETGIEADQQQHVRSHPPRSHYFPRTPTHRQLIVKRHIRAFEMDFYRTFVVTDLVFAQDWNQKDVVATWRWGGRGSGWGR